MTEDNTFEKLCRPTFPELYDEWNTFTRTKNNMATQEEKEKFFADRYWTHNEFMKELRNAKIMYAVRQMEEAFDRYTRKVP